MLRTTAPTITYTAPPVDDDDMPRVLLPGASSSTSAWSATATPPTNVVHRTEQRIPAQPELATAVGLRPGREGPQSAVTPHDLHRTFGTLARTAGADLLWIQKAMGHESITTTARIYAHLYDDELDPVAVA